MEIVEGSEGGKNGLKEETRVVPEVGNEKNPEVLGVKEKEGSIGGSVDGGKENGNAGEEKIGGVHSSDLVRSGEYDETEEKKGTGDGENVVARRKHEFSVGDLVWGKIKSHPWWPGLIYNPLDASDFALKFKNEKKLLVAYFGDGSCAWNSHSQLLPFVEHFEKMSNQSSSKSFVYAVEEALVELGRRVELKMICSCVPELDRNELARPAAMSAAVKPGTLIPEGAIDRLPGRWSEPAFLLEYVRNLKQVGSVSNSLELVLMKSWLSAFSRVKRGCCLPIYREPQLIEGLEDKSKNAVAGANDFSVPIAVPIQGPSEEECVGSTKVLPVKGLMETSTHKRKQKSVAELMSEDKNVKQKNKKNSKITEEPPSTTGSIRRRKKIENSVSGTNVVNEGLPDKVENESLLSIKRKPDEETVQDYINASTAGRKRGKKKADSSVSCSVPVNDGVQLAGDENESTKLIEPKKNKYPADDVDGDSDEKTLKRFISRDRKNSKYLSAPYTVPSPKLFRSDSKREMETKSDKSATLSKVGERLTKVAGQLISSPRLAQCNNAVSEEMMPENGLKLETNVTSSPTTSEKKTHNDSIDISASADQVCAEVLSAGVDIMSMDIGSIEPLKAFMNAFRSSTYHDQKSGKKMKSSANQPGDNGTDINNAAVVFPSPAALSEKTDKPRSRVTKLKKAARAAAGNKEVDKTSPDALIISFGSDILPSKDEIIMAFNKFGSINEDETKLLQDSNSAQVVFISPSNAELAFKESAKQCPFPGNHVKYNLRSSSDESNALESVKTTSKSPRKRTPKNPVCLQPTGTDVSKVDLVRQNLVNLTSLLNQCNGEISSEEKSSLEGEIRNILQKVGELGVKASS